MRTSRISRETAGVVDASSTSAAGPSSPRRSLRGSSRLSSVANGTPERQHTTSKEGSAPPVVDPLVRVPSNVNPSVPSKRKRATLQAPGDPTQRVKPEDANPPLRQSRRKAPKLEHDSPTETTDGTRKARRQPAKRITGPDGAVTVQPPANWQEVYRVTAEMRARVLAPVDTMGCESLADAARPPRDRRLQTLVALMLSSQTKDTVTAAAIKNLQANLPGGLTLAGLLAAAPDALNALIAKVGFHNNKTAYLKRTAEALRDRFAGDIPDSIEGLTSLPGVGPKMAYLCMSAAWGRDEGIGVDVHVHRITNLWGWHRTATPEQTRAELEAWLPREKWHDINHLLVGFGQTICAPVGRRCGECALAQKGLCPSAAPAGGPVRRRVKKEVEVDLEEAEVVKGAAVLVERDDVGVKVEAETEADGNVEILGVADSIAPGVEE